MNKKTRFTIFYSWMSDQPDDQNRRYIRNKLEEDIVKLSKSLSVELVIDSDSRGEDGSDSIDAVILKKIARCDFFVGDITSIVSDEGINGKSFVPNPNVMFELGFAVSSIGWNRCIMVCNERYGIIGNAPFDIRNHLIKGYIVGEKDLSLFEILKGKIEDYDKLVGEWRSNKEKSFDAEVFEAINSSCPERCLIDSISSFINDRTYTREEFHWWDERVYQYRHYPDGRFLDQDIHNAYESFLSTLEQLCRVAATYNIEHPHNRQLTGDEPDWDRQYRYLIINPYDSMDEDKAFEYQKKIDAEFLSLAQTVLPSYEFFRDIVRKKLII